MIKRFEVRAVFCPGGLETQPRRLEYEEQVVSGGNEIRKLGSDQVKWDIVGQCEKLDF